MEGLMIGFAELFSNIPALLCVFAGAVVGLLAGATPGLTTPAAIAMIMPITVYLSPLAALVFLYVIGKSGRYGGSISAILYNTPGTTAAAATTIDGYPLAQKGQANKALKVATVASACGDFFWRNDTDIRCGLYLEIYDQIGAPRILRNLPCGLCSHRFNRWRLNPQGFGFGGVRNTGGHGRL